MAAGIDRRPFFVTVSGLDGGIAPGAPGCACVPNLSCLRKFPGCGCDQTDCGRLAQLAEHLVYTERVGGSIPSPPTMIFARGGPQARGCRVRLFDASSKHIAGRLTPVRRFGAAMAVAAAAMAFGPARAEDMSFRVIGGPGARVVAMQGEINDDTPDAFLNFMNENVGAGNVHGVVLLDSPGGKVVASMELGRAIRRLGMAVVVARPAAGMDRGALSLASGRCYSACVYALMGGVRRVIPPGSRVGVHRMFNYSTSFDLAEGGVVRERNLDDGGMRATLSDYARAMGVSTDLVTLAERTSPDQLYMLTGADIARWRLASRKL